MFRIDYLITVEEDELIVGRYGLIEMEANGKVLNGTLIAESNPEWDEVILYYWIKSWLLCASLLYSNSYVAFTEFEASKLWLELVSEGESILIDLVKSDQISMTIITSKLENVEYIDKSPTVWHHEVVPIKEFIAEIKRVSYSYIEELSALNKKDNKMLVELYAVYQDFCSLYY